MDLDENENLTSNASGEKPAAASDHETVESPSRGAHLRPEAVLSGAEPSDSRTTSLMSPAHDRSHIFDDEEDPNHDTGHEHHARNHPDLQQDLMTEALFADPQWDAEFDDISAEELPTLKQLLQDVLASLQGEFHGCSDAEHRIHLDIHCASAGHNHHPLAATYRSLPADLKKCGLAQDMFPDNEGKSRKHHTKAADLANDFCGKAGPDDEVKNICLHIEQATVDERKRRSVSFNHVEGRDISGDDPGRSYTIQWDKDSLLYRTDHAGVFGKHGIAYCPSQLIAMTVTMSNHIKFRIQFLDEQRRTRHQSHHLKDIPHGYFGYAKGWHSCWIFIAFPRLFNAVGAFTQLTKEVWKTFFDEVWFPAVKAHATNQNIQHLPTSWTQAEERAKALAAEIGTDPDGTRASHFGLGPEVISSVWETAQRLIERSQGQLSMFEGMFLVVQAKGFKTDFQKDGESLVDVLDRVEKNAEDTWVMEHINKEEFWVDIGHEICPAPRNVHYGREAEILLWKKCCLEKQIDKWREQFDTERIGKVDFYTAFNLGEAAAITLEHAKKSPAATYGLIYSQLYNSGKEVLDAQKVQPWESELIDELSIDKRVWKGAATAARRTHGRKREDLMRNHRAIKRRVLRALTEARVNSYGIRVEHRITWRLFKMLRLLAHSTEALEEAPSATSFELPTQPSYCWSILTRTWCNYLLGNYEKLVETLEMVVWTSPKTGVSRARSKFIATLFLCIRTLSTGRMHMQNMLWLGEETRTDITRRGLNWRTLMGKHGYPWFQYGLVDFERFTFEKDISDELWISEENVLTYHPGNLNMIEVNDTMDQCSNLLKRFRNKTLVQGEILLLMAHVCFYQFRRDVLNRLSDYGELHEDAEGDALEDRIKFCAKGFDGVVAEVSLSTGNRPLKDPRIMATWLLGPDNAKAGDGFPELPKSKKRTYFKDFFFRGLLDKALEILKDFPHLNEEWPELLFTQFFMYHWLIPYPNDKGQMMGKGYTNQHENRAGERKWFAVTAPKQNTWPSKVEKERSLPRDMPADYPETLHMSEGELEDYFEGLIFRED